LVDWGAAKFEEDSSSDEYNNFYVINNKYLQHPALISPV
jgi:hypothetical protein